MAKTLLPLGFEDLTGASAKKHLSILQDATNYFIKSGYDLILPALFEYKNPKKDNNHIQIIDSLTNQVMTIRNDITDQIARIWEQQGAKKEQKYCYYGDVFYHQKDSVNRARKLTQIGVEFISDNNTQYDLEIFKTTIGALDKLRIKDYILVIAFPKLFFNYCKLKSLSETQQSKLQKYLLDKNLDAIRNSEFAELLPFIIPNQSLEKELYIEGLEAEIANIKNLLEYLRKAFPIINIIIDPFDIRQYNYHSDFVFSVTSCQLKKTIARGGRYNINDKQSAVGSSFYIEELISCAEN